ncbi:MAG: DEAD/DEAH box helicase family protein, partial [Gammaproteobacteria bacterium]|nr:DEAD/DEAH box helicase family protein [Gammaproteobacteria bacterium]
MFDRRTLTFRVFSNETEEEAQELSVFFDDWLAELAAAVDDEFEYVYDFDLSDLDADEQKVLRQIAKTKPLPGRKETGLLDGQIHTTAATWRGLNRFGYTFLQAQMGFGKTAVLAALMALENLRLRRSRVSNNGLGPRPPIFVMMTEPHLTDQMVVEMKKFWPICKPKVCERVEDILQLVKSTMVMHEYPHIAVMSRTYAKFSAGWLHCYNDKARWLKPQPGARLVPFYWKLKPMMEDLVEMDDILTASTPGSMHVVGQQRVSGCYQREYVALSDWHGRRMQGLQAGPVVFERQATFVETEMDGDIERIIPGSQHVRTIAQTIERDKWMHIGEGGSLFVRMVRATKDDVAIARCWHCGELVQDDEGTLLLGEDVEDYFTGKTQRYCEAEIERGTGVRERCGGPLWTERRVIGGTVEIRRRKQEYRPDLGLISRRWDDPSIQGYDDPVGYGLVKPPQIRYPLVEFIRDASHIERDQDGFVKRMVPLRDLFVFAGFDEVHSYARDSGQGYAMATL